MPDQDDLCINGIDGTTGGPAFDPITVADVAERVRGQLGLGPIGEIGHGHGGTNLAKPHRGSEEIGKSGWAVLVPKGLDPAFREAIEPLCSLRRGQARALYKEIDFDPETDDFEHLTRRHGVSFGNTDHASLPKYLLLLGPPTLIPFELQHLLGLEYGAGRLDFPTPEMCAAYAESIVAYETRDPGLTEREVCFWGPRRDPATDLSSTDLLTPLALGAGRLKSIGQETGSAVTTRMEDDATKEHLLAELHRPSSMKPPTMLFTASHGLSYPLGNPLQGTDQGALVTADWYPGEPVSPACRVAASDIGDDARIHGMVAFLFACFGAATPAFDSYPRDRSAPARQLAPAPFVSPLPQRLLAHPAGGALGVFGHVDRAWGYSLKRAADVPQVGTFRAALLRVFRGAPLGDVLAEFAIRAAGLSSAIVASMSSRTAPSDRDLAMRFIERNDAAGYVLLGDPGASVRDVRNMESK